MDTAMQLAITAELNAGGTLSEFDKYAILFALQGLQRPQLCKTFTVICLGAGQGRAAQPAQAAAATMQKV